MNSSTQTFGICFVLRNNKSAKQDALIHARITVDSQRIEFSLKRNINPANWNQVKGCAKGTKEEFRSLNNYLEQVKRRILECREELLLDEQEITPVAVKNLYLGINDKQSAAANWPPEHKGTTKPPRNTFSTSSPSKSIQRTSKSSESTTNSSLILNYSSGQKTEMTLPIPWPTTQP